MWMTFTTFTDEDCCWNVLIVSVSYQKPSLPVVSTETPICFCPRGTKLAFDRGNSVFRVSLSRNCFLRFSCINRLVATHQYTQHTILTDKFDGKGQLAGSPCLYASLSSYLLSLYLLHCCLISPTHNQLNV